MKTIIRFVSRNAHKIAEAKRILEAAHVEILGTEFPIEELQTKDTRNLVKDKALKAFRIYAGPLLVEHTGLYMKQLNDLPGGLTQIFWDALQAERFCELFGHDKDNSVEAKTVLCYVDGFKCHFFEGSITGKIADVPRGSRDFQWDCIFIPNGETQTFAEMGDKKNDISMRRRALDEFVKILPARI